MGDKLGPEGAAMPSLSLLAEFKNVIEQTLRSIAKDLRLEWRSKDAINAVAFFALLVVFIFAFAFDPTADESRRIAGGIIWVALLFAGVLALNQAWTRELRHRVLDAYRLSPASPAALFFGKTVANFLLLCAIEAVIAPLFVAIYNLRALGSVAQLVLVFPLGTWALVVNGTFFAALSVRTRNREVMLPLLLFPISIPALIAMVEATTALLTNDFSPHLWVRVLAGYDVIFTVVSLLLFEMVLNAE